MSLLPRWIKTRRGPTKDPGKVSSALTSLSQTELKEREQEIDTLRAQTDEIRRSLLEFQVDSILLTSALKTAFDQAMTINFNSWGDCVSCKHGREHHNSDKRMNSGRGRCVCGGCKKYADPLGGTYQNLAYYAQPSGSYVGFPLASGGLNSYSVTNGSYQSSNKATARVTTMMTLQEVAAAGGQTSIGMMVINKVMQANPLIVMDVSKVKITSIQADSSIFNNTVQITVDFIEY